jgi:hypothetical protein
LVGIAPGGCGIGSPDRDLKFYLMTNILFINSLSQMDQRRTAHSGGIPGVKSSGDAALRRVPPPQPLLRLAMPIFIPCLCTAFSRSMHRFGHKLLGLTASETTR